MGQSEGAREPVGRQSSYAGTPVRRYARTFVRVIPVLLTAIGLCDFYDLYDYDPAERLSGRSGPAPLTPSS